MTTPTNEPMTVEDIPERYKREAEEMNQPLEVVMIKRRATDMFHNDHDDGDTAIYQVVAEMLEWHTTQINALIARARLDELARGKEYVTKLRVVWLTQENKLDGDDPLAEKGIAIRNHLRDEIVEDFDARIAELQQLLQKGENDE